MPARLACGAAAALQRRVAMMIRMAENAIITGSATRRGPVALSRGVALHANRHAWQQDVRAFRRTFGAGKRLLMAFAAIDRSMGGVIETGMLEPDGGNVRWRHSLVDALGRVERGMTFLTRRLAEDLLCEDVLLLSDK